jgi:hypothetical protein
MNRTPSVPALTVVFVPGKNVYAFRRGTGVFSRVSATGCSVGNAVREFL